MSLITEQQRTAYQNTLESKLQQVISKLKGRAMSKSFSGKMLVITERGTVTFTEEFSRHAPTNPTEEDFLNRALVKRSFQAAKIYARNDPTFIADLSDPSSSIYQEFEKGWYRAIDDVMISALTGTAYGGDAPHTTPITVPTSQTVPANYTRAVPTGTGSNTPLSPMKIRRARVILEKNDVAMSDMILVLSPNHDDALEAWLETMPNDKAAAAVAKYLENPTDGANLMGFTIVKSNRLTKSGTVQTAIAYDKNSLMISPDTMENHLDILVNQSHSKQAASYGMFGAARRREEGVVLIGSEIYE